VIAAIAIALLAGALAAAAQREPPSAAELPPRDAFLREVQKRLRSDASILAGYRYRRTVVERERNEQGRVTEIRTRVYDVRPLPDDPDGYRILVSKDGVATPARDVARAEEEYVRRLQRALRPQSPSDAASRRARDAQAAREEQETVRDVVRVFEVSLTRRETVRGVPAVRVDFAPRAAAEPRTRAGRVLRSVRGHAWFSEQEYELVRVEAQVFEPIEYGWGILARINPGAHAEIDRQRTDDGVWLPARYELAGKGRVLLLKSVQREGTVTFSDFERAAGPPARP
jgi:hypothetical protein